MHHGKFGEMNNFHFVRLTASIMVLFSHSFYLFSPLSKDPLHTISSGIFTFGNIGVYIFLIVSGFLITKSILNSSSIKNFIWRRILRIFPALWVMVLLSVFLIGPILTNESLTNYIRNSNNYLFLKNLGLFFPNNYKINAVFTSNPLGTFNGCLWTIPYEVFFYIVLLIIYVLQFFRYKLILLIQWLLFIVLQLYLGNKIYVYSYSSPWILNLNIESFFRLFIFFESGVLIYLFKDVIYSNRFLLKYLFFSIIIICFFRFSNFSINIILPPILIYFAIYNNRFSFVEKFGDLSYGLYLYGYIVQQIIVSFKIDFMNEYLLFIFSLIISLIIAYCSWHYIEKPMLRLKNLVK